MLEQNELIRYNRQLIIPNFGEEGQRKLKDSHIIIVGIGGLGCASATYLTAAGVGHITIVDFDTVELSDLNRQILYWEDEIGDRKVVVAQRKLSKLNPSVEITPIFAKITNENVLGIIDRSQVVVDGLDNSATRLVVNSACIKQNIPYIYGGVSRLRGMITTIIPGQTPCLACLLPESVEGLGGLGVLGVTPALIANLQALEVIKLLIGHSPSLAGKLLIFNGDDIKFRVYEIRRNENCPVCSQALHL
ncbi:MAG: HesA/MoeB/ThiF family protein [Chloroflexi bacterium]|nr:HesA/MoeB/ThiF family protein [Chloroflexota bacterium]MBL7061981.1 HesA/MoeB/ThiF family protein [Dehalococcoidia bacterium]